jgi:hypothetical protein
MACCKFAELKCTEQAELFDLVVVYCCLSTQDRMLTLVLLLSRFSVVFLRLCLPLQ